MTNNNNMTETEIINGHKVSLGLDGEFPWIQIDDGPKYFADTDGDHWGSIGIDNAEDYKGTILEAYITNSSMYSDEEEDGYFFDMGGQFFIYNDQGRPELIDYDECILKPLGMIDNYEGAYGNG
jgi:hypothetical protein